MSGRAADGSLRLVSGLPEDEGGEAAKGALGWTPRRRPASSRGAVSDRRPLRVLERRRKQPDGAVCARHGRRRDRAARRTLQAGVVGTGTDAPIFQGASADGTRAFFTDTRELTPDAGAGEGKPRPLRLRPGPRRRRRQMRADRPDAGSRRRRSRPTCRASPSAIDEAGEDVYFVANGALAPGAAPGTAPPNPRRRGQPQPLPRPPAGRGMEHRASSRTLSNLDAPDWGVGLVSGKAKRSSPPAPRPSGRYLAFMSQRTLTGYDNRDAASGEADRGGLPLRLARPARSPASPATPPGRGRGGCARERPSTYPPTRTGSGRDARWRRSCRRELERSPPPKARSTNPAACSMTAASTSTPSTPWSPPTPTGPPTPTSTSPARARAALRRPLRRRRHRPGPGRGRLRLAALLGLLRTRIEPARRLPERQRRLHLHRLAALGARRRPRLRHLRRPRRRHGGAPPAEPRVPGRSLPAGGERARRPDARLGEPSAAPATCAEAARAALHRPRPPRQAPLQARQAPAPQRPPPRPQGRRPQARPPRRPQGPPPRPPRPRPEQARQALPPREPKEEPPMRLKILLGALCLLAALPALAAAGATEALVGDRSRRPSDQPLGTDRTSCRKSTAASRRQKSSPHGRSRRQRSAASAPALPNVAVSPARSARRTPAYAPRRRGRSELKPPLGARFEVASVAPRSPSPPPGAGWRAARVTPQLAAAAKHDRLGSAKVLIASGAAAASCSPSPTSATPPPTAKPTRS